MPETSFFKELQKRKVVQVAAVYGAVAWGVTEVVVNIVSQLFLPQWVSTLSGAGGPHGLINAMSAFFRMMDSVNKNPAASSASLPGVRIVIDTLLCVRPVGVS